MKKRVVSLLMALMLLMSLLPVGVMADGGESTVPTVVSSSAGSSNATELYVNGVNILTATNNTVECDGGTASYDADSNTLTLTNATIDKAHDDGFGIFATGDLTISLSGESTIEGSDIKDGIVVFGSLTITGSDTSAVSSLTVTGSEFGIMVGLPNAANNLTIRGNGVTVTANGNDSVGIDVAGILNIVDSTVIGKSTGNSIIARSITVTGGRVTGDDGNVGISAGSITVEKGGSVSGTGTGNNSEGILSTSVTVNSGGSVTGTGTAANSIGVNVYSLEVNGGTLEGRGTDSGVLSRSITVTGGSVSGTGSSTGISVYYDDENDAAITISSGGSVTATSTTAGRGIYAPGMNISIDNTSTLTASAKFGGVPVNCSSLSVAGNPCEPVDDATVFKAENGNVTWITSTSTLYVNGVDVLNDDDKSVACGEGGTATYDPSTNTLTLNCATVTAAHEECGIFSQGDLIINLIGDSTINGGSITNGINVTGNLTITGTGSLKTAGSSAGISVSKSLSIDGDSTVTASSTSGGAPVSCSSISVAGESCEPVTGATIFKAEKGVTTWIKGVSTLYVDGVNILTDIDNTITCGSGTATYDPSTNTLTLNGATITAPYTTTVGRDQISCGIYADDDLNINLIGTSTVKNESNPFTNGVYVDGSLTITGDGSLEATGSSQGISAGSLTVESGSITGTGVDQGISVSGTMTVSGGTVVGNAARNDTYSESQGIKVNDLIVTGSGSVTGTCNTTNQYGHSTGIDIGGSMTVSDDGEVIGTGTTEGPDSNAYGIKIYADVTINGGSVIGKATTTGDTKTYGSNAVGIDIGPGNMTVNGGTVEATGTTTGETSKQDSTAFTGVNAFGIYGTSNIIINGGSVSATGSAQHSEDCYGIQISGSVSISQSSRLTATSGVAGRTVDASSITAAGEEHTPSPDATVLKVENGVITESTPKPITELWVNGVNMLENSTVECGTGTATFDPATNTLTLDNASITLYSSGMSYAGIRAQGDLIINLIGDSVIENEKVQIGLYMLTGNLTIKGTGSLTAKGTEDGISVTHDGDMTVESGTVTGVSTSAGRGILVSDNMTVNAGAKVSGRGLKGVLATRLTVNDSSVTGTGTSGYGINISFGINVNGGTVTGTGSYGIEGGILTVNGGTVNGTGNQDGYGLGVSSITVNDGGTVTGKGTGKDGYGIYVIYGDMTVNSGSVTGNGDDYGIFIERGGMTVNDGGSVSATSTNRSAIYTSENMIVNGGSITGIYTGKLVQAEGVYVFGNMTVIDGTVTGTGYYGTSVGGILTVNGGSVSGTGYYGTRVGGNLTVNGGSVSGIGTHWGVRGSLTMTGGTVTGKGGNAAIAFSDLESEATAEPFNLPAGYLPSGYKLDTATSIYDGNGTRYTCTSIVPEGVSLVYDVNAGTVTGAVKEITLKAGQSGTVDAPSITDEPEHRTVAEGASATFTVTATGDSLTYQWQQRADNGATWTDIDGATAAGYTIAAATTDMNGYQYRCVVRNSAGSVESAAATLTVTATPTTTYTATVTASEGGTVSGGGTYAEGETVHLTATENEGYHFVRWEVVSGAVTIQNNSFTMPAGDVTVNAVFEKDAGGEPTDPDPEQPDQPEQPDHPDTPTTPTTPTTPGKDPSQQAVDKIENAQGGETVSVDLTTGKAELDKEVFEELSGKDTTLEVKVPGGVTWTVNGKDIPADADFSDLDMSVVMDTKTIPEEAINSVNSEAGTMQLTVKNDGEFGFTMTMTAPVGTKNAGMWANLYQYDKAAGKMVYKASALVDRNGDAALPVGSSGEYALVLDSKSHELPFTDLATGAWYDDAVAYVYRHDLMDGVGISTFAPNATTSRAMIATILWRMAGSPVVSGSLKFSDVADGQWYSEAIRWAASEGIVDGYDNGKFGPDDPITREQFAAMLWRYAKSEGYDVSVGENTNILSYADAMNVSEYAVPAMQWACGAGIIEGVSESTLVPQGRATRAQAAVLLMRLCEKYVKW